jgi:hypothetical protein
LRADVSHGDLARDLDPAPVLHARLWSAAGVPDPEASRAYRILTPEGPRMVIAETFRQGMLMARGLGLPTLDSCPP